MLADLTDYSTKLHKKVFLNVTLTFSSLDGLFSFLIIRYKLF